MSESDEEIRAQIVEFGVQIRRRANEPELELDEDFDREMRSLLSDIERKVRGIKSEAE